MAAECDHTTPILNFDKEAELYLDELKVNINLHVAVIFCRYHSKKGVNNSSKFIFSNIRI